MTRRVRLVVVDGAGTALGTLPEFEVGSRHWPETADVVAGAWDRFGIELTVLRILAMGSGADATYLAEAAGLPPAYAGPVGFDLSAHPSRHAYAEPGGPAAAVDWATTALDRLDRGPVLTATQIRTWNLSTIWRLDTATGPAWLKVVPPFFAHEGAVLRFLADVAPIGPELLAGEGTRMLLADVPGTDLYGAGLPVRLAIAAKVTAMQLAAAGTISASPVRNTSAGVPDRRAPALLDQLTAVVERHGHGDPRLARLIDGLPARLAAVADCGLPDTLVHGDLHPGNVRGGQSTPDDLVVIDWGDSFVGQPGFDALRLAGGLEPADAATLIGAWAAAWRAADPGRDPERAVELLRPVAALRSAAVYADFLDQIEPAEHPYHIQDVPDCLNEAAEMSTVD